MKHDQLLKEYIEVYLSAFKKIDDLISEPMKADKLSFDQFLVLRTLLETEQMTLSDIAKVRGVTRAAIARQLKPLVARQWVVQREDEHDKRRLLLALTPAGREVAQRINRAAEARFDDWVAVLGQQDTKDLLRIMRTVNQKLM